VRSRLVVYGAFKAMGDLLNAAPVIKAELDAGTEVALLLFSRLGGFLDLLDFGAHHNRLQVYLLPVSGRFADIRRFMSEMARLSPDLVWVSPHAPAPAASWRIPLLLWLTKRLYWPRAQLCGARSEPLSRLFDKRVNVDRGLPFLSREWAAYTACCGRPKVATRPVMRFSTDIQEHASCPPLYDLLIHPGAGAENRKWPLNNYPELLRQIPEGYRVAILGLPADLEAMKSVLGTDRPITWLTGTLKDALISIARARVVLAMDSGTGFFAAALGIAGVALFGASNPANVIGYDTSVNPLYNVACRFQPCGSARCRQTSLLCMQALTPSMVGAELNRMLQLAEMRGSSDSPQ
jgi:heptosyltransferase II